MRTHDVPRVLHVLHALNRGGVEKWLLDVLRSTPPGSWSTEFLVHTTEPAAYDAQARALGAVLRVGPDTRQPLRYVSRLRQLLLEHGPYDVVHSHLHLFSGFVLRAAHRAGVPVRIAQSNTTEPVSGAGRTMYAALMRHWIRRHATHRMGISAQSAAALFGADWRTQPHTGILHCTLDFSAYARLAPRAALRQELGLPGDRIIIGHVGRLDPVKNHRFLVEAFAELVRLGVDAHLLLVGTGPLESAVRRHVDALGLTPRCTFAGGTDHVAPFFGAMDLMLFPSVYEGLALAPLEAQAADVPVLASHAVPPEAEVVRERLHRLPLEAGPGAWARVARQILATARLPDRAAAAGALQASRFGVAQSIEHMARLYGATLPDTAPPPRAAPPPRSRLREAVP